MYLKFTNVWQIGASTPDIIAISENKLNNNSNSVMTYNYLDILSLIKTLTQADGVGMYVKTNLIYKIRSDLDFYNNHIEYMWTEVTDVNNTSFEWVHFILSHSNNNTKHFGEIIENSINISKV